MTGNRYYVRAPGLVLLLAGLTIFLTGCFDLDQEVWITADPENSYSRATITTTSEELYEFLKDSMSEEYEEDEVEFRVIESKDPEGEVEFEIWIETELEEDSVGVFAQNGTVAYELKLLGEEEEMDEMSETLFEGHYFKFTLYTPKPIKNSWWGKYYAEERTPVDPELVEGNKLSLELELQEAMSPDYAYVTVVTERQ
jgi:hypothetical protein